MEFRNTLSMLHANSQEIGKLIERLEKAEEVRLIDIDLLLDKIRNVYEIVSDIRMEIPSLSEKPEPSAEKKVDVLNTVMSDESVASEDEIVEFENTGQNESEGVEKEKEYISSDGKKSFIAETFKSGEKILNEEIAPAPEKSDLASQLTGTPIRSIDSAIGLNDKFELVSELFKGSVEQFETCIDRLNQASSFVDAYNYLEGSYKWDMDNPYVQRILELVRRKLIVKRDDR